MFQVGRTFGIRDGMLRLEYELRRGTGLLSWRMRTVQGWNSWGLEKIAPGVRIEEILRSRRDGSHRFFFADARTLQSGIKSILAVSEVNSVLAEAEAILEGNLPYFGQPSVACGFPPQWFQNPFTKQTVSPRDSWTQMRFASPTYGDLKFILEPSRFLFVYPLARAYALSADERYPQAFWSAVEDWASHSPPMSGPLWICGQECSLRILAWSFALHAFIGSASTTNERVSLLISMIASHAWRTAQTLGYARSQRSNHLISEAVGLWTAGTLFPELREAHVWRNLGAHLLHEAVLDQITPEGVSQQFSFNYQRMIVHLLLWTLRLAEIHNAPLHEEIRRRTEGAFEFLRVWVDLERGLAPNYGSDDGSLIFPLASGSYRDFRPVLQLGAAVLDRSALPRGHWDEAALWFGMRPSRFEASSPIPQISTETGFFRLGDESSWAMIRAGRYTRRPFHADQLHVDLWWRGMNLARDPGTYLYNGTAPWNNGLAGTSVHNSVTVDGGDQMRRAGRFLWLDWAQASGRSSSSQRLPSGRSLPDHFEGEHDGYRSRGAEHRRTVQWLWGAGWVIVDDIEGYGERDLRLHWLTADLPYEISASPFQVTFRKNQSTIRWTLFSLASTNAFVIRSGKREWMRSESADEYKPDFSRLGWESQTYGDLRPAVSLLFHTRSRLPVRFVTVVVTDECCFAESDGESLIIVRTESGKPRELYRVSLSPRATKRELHAIGSQRSKLDRPPGPSTA